MAFWGVHPEDVAAVPVDLGAAMIFDSKDFTDKIDDGTQVLIISHPTSRLTSNITSPNLNEQKINTNKKFIKYLKGLTVK